MPRTCRSPGAKMDPQEKRPRDSRGYSDVWPRPRRSPYTLHRLAAHLTDVTLSSVEIGSRGEIEGLNCAREGLVAAKRQKGLRVPLCIGGELVTVVALPSRLSDPVIARNLWDSWPTSAKRKGWMASIWIGRAVRRSCKSQRAACAPHLTSSFAVDFRKTTAKS